MINFIIQRFIIACLIAIFGIMLSRIANKSSKSVKISYVSEVLDEITSDFKRGGFAIAIVFFVASIIDLFSDELKSDFVVKNILSGLVLIGSSIGVALGTIAKEKLTKHYETVNISEKDRSITLTLIPIVGSILRYLNFSLSFLTILHIWGVNITPVLSGTAIALAVFGFAGQSVLQDLLGFGTLIIDRPFYVGSEIEFVFDFGAERGFVKEITLRNTVIENEAGYLFYIPNRDAKNFRVWKL